MFSFFFLACSAVGIWGCFILFPMLARSQARQSWYDEHKNFAEVISEVRFRRGIRINLLFSVLYAAVCFGFALKYAGL